MGTYIDLDHRGQVDEKGNLIVLKDQDALANAVKLWLCSFRGERLYKPTKGGYVISALLKPICDERIDEIKEAIMIGLREDFQPAIEVSKCTVIPDYDEGRYYITVEGWCPKFRAAVYTDASLNSLTR